jgi:FdhE protein
VAGGFIRKLFGQSEKVPAAVEPALAELARLTKERSGLLVPATLLGDLLPLLYAQPVAEHPPPLNPEESAAKLAGGIPLLRGERITLDERAFHRRWQGICVAVQRHQEGGSAQAVAEALRQGRLVPAELLQEVLAGRAEAVRAHADALDLDAGLLGTVLRLTLFPVLSHINSALAPLRTGQTWEQGYCPTCGSCPLLGEFRGLEQTRYLRCGWCASEWAVPRLLCPFCGTRDHHLLGFLNVSGEEARQRASTCGACHAYVKTVATLGALDGPGLLVEDVATLHLDLAAAERGYFLPG